MQIKAHIFVENKLFLHFRLDAMINLVPIKKNHKKIFPIINNIKTVPLNQQDLDFESIENWKGRNPRGETKVAKGE